MPFQTVLYDRVSTLYKKIDVVSWELNFNYKCHINSYHYAKEYWYEVVSCMCWDGWGIIAHFINYDPKTKKYIDNTVWNYRCYHTYYLIKHFTISEFTDPPSELEYLKKEIYNLLPLWRKLFTFTTWKHF